MTEPSRQPPRSVVSSQVWWHVFAIVAICFLVYGNSLAGAFVWDDELQIVKNPTIRSLSNVPEAFTTPFWGFANGGEANRTNFFRPMQTVAYSAGYALGDLSPLPDHFLSVTFHAIACAFLYLIAIELGLSSSVALLAAALFAVHPIHTEAVAWIAGFPDVACGAFFFGSFWAFLRGTRERGGFWLALSCLLYFAALLSKEMAITLPLFLLWFSLRPPDLSGVAPPRTKNIWIELAPYGAVTVVYLLMRAHALGFLATTHLNAEASAFDWITLGIYVLGEYIWYTVIPYPLVAYHLVPLHFADRAVFTIVAFLCIASLAAVAWKSRRRWPDLWFWCVSFAILLIPVFYFKGISMTFLAERYLYIPSFAAVLLAASLMSRPSTHLPTSKNLFLAGWLVVALFALGTFARNRDWNTSERLYTETLAGEPGIAHFDINLADIEMNRGDDAGARQHFELALRSLSGNTYVQVPYDRYRAEIGVGALDARAHRYPEARKHFENALRIYPQGDWGYLYLGGISLEADNDYPRAIAYFQKAIELGPLNEVARDYLGIAMMNQGKYKEAAAYFSEALKINPTDQDAQKHLELANRAANQPVSR